MTVKELLAFLQHEEVTEQSEVMIDTGINVFDSIGHIEYCDGKVLLSGGDYTI